MADVCSDHSPFEILTVFRLPFRHRDDAIGGARQDRLVTSQDLRWRNGAGEALDGLLNGHNRTRRRGRLPLRRRRHLVGTLTAFLLPEMTPPEPEPPEATPEATPEEATPERPAAEPSSANGSSPRGKGAVIAVLAEQPGRWLTTQEVLAAMAEHGWAPASDTRGRALRAVTNAIGRAVEDGKVQRRSIDRRTMKYRYSSPGQPAEVSPRVT
jgi:hypothetical protein